MQNEHSDTEIRRQLAALASHLAKRQQALLDAWREASEQAGVEGRAASMTRIQFEDHLPEVLDLLNTSLRTWPVQQACEQIRSKLDEHGAQRWLHGYQLHELLGEWGHLQLVLTDAFEAYALTQPILPEAMAAARKILARLCVESTNRSAKRYWRLHQAESASHVGQLEQALGTLQELTRLRADIWRQAAHDLRGSLSVVHGASSELASEDLTDSLRQDFLVLLQKGMDSLQDILSELTSLARLDAGQEVRQLCAFDAAELLEEVCRTSQTLAQQRGLYLKSAGPPSLPVQGDRIKLLRIVQNLLLNSLKYTREGGVTVCWDTGSNPATDTWTICIQDTGPGLPLARQLPIEGELRQATWDEDQVRAQGAGEELQPPPAPLRDAQCPASAQHGEGLGLSIVKRLCELLDATLELESRPGKGATFRITLPRSYGVAEG